MEFLNAHLFAAINIGSTVSYIGIIITIIAAFGGAAGYFKAARGDTIIKLQGTEIDSLRRTNADLEKTVATVTESCNAKDQTIAELRKHNSYLQKLGQGSPQLKKLTSAIEAQTKAFTEYFKKENKK